MRRGALIASAIAALVVGGAVVVCAFGYWTPWAAGYTKGIDISAHQGPIDWRTLARSDVRFVYIKATEGSDFTDPRFAANWRDAGAAGLYRGAYHYFTLCRPGAQQATNFIHVAPRGENMLPPAVDLEHMGPCRHGPTASDVVGEVRAYLDRVEAYYGARPILYTTREFHDAHLADFPRERFWIRSLYAQPDFRQSEWVFWQHHNMARHAGVSGPVDLDVFRGDERALARLTSRPGVAT